MDCVTVVGPVTVVDAVAVVVGIVAVDVVVVVPIVVVVGTSLEVPDKVQFAISGHSQRSKAMLQCNPSGHSINFAYPRSHL